MLINKSITSSINYIKTFFFFGSTVINKNLQNLQKETNFLYINNY